MCCFTSLIYQYDIDKKNFVTEVSDAVLNNIYVMDHLKNRLDTSLRGLQNWRYLAGVNKVSIDKQQRWQLGEYYSKSEKMFETLKAKSPKLSMTSLVTHLQALEINGVKKYIEDHQLQSKCALESYVFLYNSFRPPLSGEWTKCSPEKKKKTIR